MVRDCWQGWADTRFVWLWVDARDSVLAQQDRRIHHPDLAVDLSSVRPCLPCFVAMQHSPSCRCSVVAGIITDLHVFVKTDFHVMYLTFFLYSASMIGMAFALASVISTTKVGNILSFLLFIIGMIFNVFNISGFGYLLFDPSIFSDTAIKAMMFYPPLDFAKAYADIDYVTRPSLVWDFDQLKHVVQEGGDYTWSSLNGDTYSRANQTSATGGGTYHVPPTMETLEWMSIAYLVFVFLAWYLGQIITGGHGRPQYPWFPLDPTFWGLNLCGRVPSDVSKAGVDIRVRTCTWFVWVGTSLD